MNENEFKLFQDIYTAIFADELYKNGRKITKAARRAAFAAKKAVEASRAVV